MRFLLKLLLLPMAIGVVLLALGYFNYQAFVGQPLRYEVGSSTDGQAGPGRLFVVERGWSLKRVSRKLVEEGILDQQRWFELYARFEAGDSPIKAGEYWLEPGLTPPALMTVLTSGKSIQYSESVIEGTTYRQLLERLANNDRLVQRISGDTAVMAAIGKPEVHPEGQFFADTYAFSRGSSDIDFLKRASAELDRVLQQEWAERAADLPLKTPYEALILASIVEKETAVANERPLIAGVFMSRLKKGMRLQTDPTVIYGIGESFDGNIRRSDLTTDTPYNTYTRAGLPPTPIALVGREAIHAVMHPAETTALYFVARGDGTHQFSDTVEAHNEAVRQYQLNRKRRSASQGGQ